MLEFLRARLRRLDSVFVRLLLLQVLLALGLSALYFGLYLVERNRTLAVLLADQWARPIARATGMPVASTAPPQPDNVPVHLRQQPPQAATLLPSFLARVHGIRDELARFGITVGQVAWEDARPVQVIWVEVIRPGRPAVWAGVPGPLLEARETGRLFMGLGLGIGLVLLLAWHPASRVAHRLDRLRMRIRNGVPLPPEQGTLGAVPEIVEIERAFDELLARLLRQQSERSLLLAGVSHDLRSPLGRIRMAAELLPDEPALQARRETIIANVRAADRLIGSFLDYVRSSELPMNEAVDVAETARVVAATYAPAAEGAGAGPHAAAPCALRLDVPDCVELPRASQHLIERALHNLIDNAFKHGAAPVTLRVTERAGAVVIEVEDTGPGVPPESRATVLQAFARGDASRGRPGSGLGLAVVQQVAERLGGAVAFDGGPGASIVRLHLPLARREGMA